MAAVALGACIIEKHFTLSRELPSPDRAFSLEPDEFRRMVDAVRVAEQALGQVHYGLNAKEEGSRVFRRSLFVVQDMTAGEPFTSQNVRAIRPGHGLHTRYLEQVLGAKPKPRSPEAPPWCGMMWGERVKLNSQLFRTDISNAILGQQVCLHGRSGLWPDLP